MMEEALKVNAAYQQVKAEQCLQEEALLMVDALVLALKGNFLKYVPHFASHLKVGLENTSDVRVCVQSLGMVTNLARGLGAELQPYCDTIFNIIFMHLQKEKPAVDRKILASIMPTFGEVALAVTGNFEKYLVPVVGMLAEACKTRLSDGPANDEDWSEYLSSLREAVLEAYTGIVHGLKDGGKLELFKLHVNTVLHFINTITEEPPVDHVWNAAIALIGDLIQAFQQEMAAYLQGVPFLPKLSQFAAGTTDPKINETTQRLQQLFAKFSSGVN